MLKALEKRHSTSNSRKKDNSTEFDLLTTAEAVSTLHVQTTCSSLEETHYPPSSSNKLKNAFTDFLLHFQKSSNA
jgi:hypothetical protein